MYENSPASYFSKSEIDFVDTKEAIHIYNYQMPQDYA